MSAKCTGGTFHGGSAVTVECPKLEQDESGVGFTPCEAEIEVEVYSKSVVFIDKKCPCCDTVFAENDVVRAAIEAAALDAVNNYEPSEAQLQALMEGPSFAETVELENRDRWRFQR
jgi:hypothetical protein